MAKPKYDYSGDEFYEEVLTLAVKGLTDAEIADGLNLAPEVFCRMKAGSYGGWNETQNQQRSQRICQVLTRGRRKINAIVRGAYLKAAIGGKRVKSKTKVYRRLKFADGSLSDNEDVQTSETEQELPPNIQALATWLFHHDDEWRKRSKGETEQEEGDMDIENWIKENSK